MHQRNRAMEPLVRQEWIIKEKLQKPARALPWVRGGEAQIWNFVGFLLVGSIRS